MMKRAIAIGLLTLFAFATGYLYGGLNHEIATPCAPCATPSPSPALPANS